MLDNGEHLSPSHDLWYGNHGFIFNEQNLLIWDELCKTWIKCNYFENFLISGRGKEKLKENNTKKKHSLTQCNGCREEVKGNCYNYFQQC